MLGIKPPTGITRSGYSGLMRGSLAWVVGEVCMPMPYASASRGPPFMVRPSNFYGLDNDTFGLSDYHDQYFHLIKRHLEKEEVCYSCHELLPGDEYSLKSRFVVHLECTGDQYELFQNFGFAVIATNGTDHFVYNAEISIPWGFTFPECSVNVIAALLAGDKELQGALESTVENGSAEKRIIQGIEVISCEWRMI